MYCGDYKEMCDKRKCKSRKSSCTDSLRVRRWRILWDERRKAILLGEPDPIIPVKKEEMAKEESVEEEKPEDKTSDDKKEEDKAE
mgnify:CR=1 FL=1